MAEKQSQAEKRKKFLKRHGLSRFNKAVRTTEGGKHVMLKILQKVLQVPLIGLIKFFGLVQGGVKKVLLNLRNMLKAVSPKGNVYKAIKGTESVEILENNRDRSK